MEGNHNEVCINNYQIPTWAGKPVSGLHIDVVKDGKLIHVPIGSEIHFGASTRVYVIREKIGGSANEDKLFIGPANRPGTEDITGDSGDGILQLPETEIELDSLTEFNTARNRRIGTIINNSVTEVGSWKKKKKGLFVHYNDTDVIINPEDIDPSIGRFRNLVEEVFIPNKRSVEGKGAANMGVSQAKRPTPDLNMKSQSNINRDAIFNPNFALASKMCLPVPNLAPDIDEASEPTLPSSITLMHSNASHPNEEHRPVAEPLSQAQKAKQHEESYLGTFVPYPTSDGLLGHTDDDLGKMSSAACKKKYVKEAWPGKKPLYTVN